MGDSVAVAEEAANGPPARLRVRYPRTMSGSSNPLPVFFDRELRAQIVRILRVTLDMNQPDVKILRDETLLLEVLDIGSNGMS